MNSVASSPALIGVDWGTSSFRAFLIGAKGEVIDRVSSPGGIMQLGGESFEAALERLIGPWISGAELPILASGMITSRNGWVETPYAELPLGAETLAGALVPHETRKGLRLHFITGAATEDEGGPDVMRGEETQIVGAVASGLEDGLFVMPGTHSKWVEVRAGKITAFSTWMTGDIFAALRGHTILSALMEEGEDEEALKAGVAHGLNGGNALLHNLFHVRSLPLMGRIPKAAASDYLSGLLIGSEIAGATGGAENTGVITIIGRDDLSDRYEIALRAAGLESRRAPGDIVAKGHFLIAEKAGLLA